MEEHYKNKMLGYWIAMIGAILGIGVNVAIFFTQYNLMIAAQIAQYPMRTNWMVITYILPVFSGMGVIAGFMYMFGMSGFFANEKNAYKITMIANVIALLFSFWPFIPALDTGMTPYYLLIFLPNAIIYLLLNLLVGKKKILRVTFCLVTGMTMVMSYINGTASLNIFWMRGLLYYRIANPIHWAVMLCMGVITVMIMFKPKNWMRWFAIAVSVIEMGIGIPMGIMTTIEKGEFSMYLGAPGLSIIIIVVVAVPFLWEKIVKAE
ncbi:MAG: hypothetical protein ACTSRE_07225 [Promethearchaeota archaeon]